MGKVVTTTGKAALAPVLAPLKTASGLMWAGFGILLLFICVAAYCGKKPDPNPIVDVHTTPSPTPVINTEIVDNTDQAILDNQQAADKVDEKADDTIKKIDNKTKVIAKRTDLTAEQKDKLVAEAEITELHDLYNALYK